VVWIKVGKGQGRHQTTAHWPRDSNEVQADGAESAIGEARRHIRPVACEWRWAHWDGGDRGGARLVQRPHIQDACWDEEGLAAQYGLYAVLLLHARGHQCDQACHKERVSWGIVSQCVLLFRVIVFPFNVLQVHEV